MAHNPKFSELLKQIEKLHDRKNADYGTEKDPFSNFRECERLGIPDWKGTLVRMGDKWTRICNIVRKNETNNEPLEDAFLDLGVYSLICYLLYKEKFKK